MRLALNEFLPDCRYFVWKEVLWLSRWELAAFPDEEKISWNLVKITRKLDIIRRDLGRSVRITSGWRPPKYNKEIGGALKSYHMRGMALDFQVANMTTVDVRKILFPRLGELGLRMEKHWGDWMHIDTGEPGPSGRYFQP